MKNKFMKSTAILALSTGVLFSSLPTSTYSSVAYANVVPSVEQVLAELTPEQRKALHQLQVSDQTGLQLGAEVNLESEDEITVIVEFKDKPAKVAVLEEAANGTKLSMAKAQQKADAAHVTFKQDLQTIYKEDVKQRKEVYKVKNTYKNTLNGVSMEIPANKVEALLQSNTVKAIWNNEIVQMEPPVKQETVEGEEETKRVTFPGIDKLHQEGFTGKGIKVGVIDTGIDYNHPDLKDAYKGGYDFVDNDNDPMETTYDEWKASGYSERDFFGNLYYTQHGTHVAGIIAGQGENNVEHSVTGVAPDADLYAYRVLGPWGSGTTEAILAGIDKAVAEGMDVINLSLGQSYNDPLFITSMALNNAVLAGVTSVVASGNTGEGLYTLGSPGAAALAITVGASNVSESIATSKGSLHAAESVPVDLKLLAKGYQDNIEELEGMDLPVVDVGAGFASDYKNKDVNGKIVFVNRISHSLESKIMEAQKQGAKAVMIWNILPEEGFIPTYLGEGYGLIPTFSLSYDQGIAMQEKLKTGEATFSFDEIGQVMSEGDQLASFSSRGPARTTYDIKPEVTAPGESIFSTVPSYMNGPDQMGDYQYAYDRLSGTSMASPNVAGVAALLLQANPDLTPADIKQVIMNTADPLNGEYSVYEVGAGNVDPYEAIHSTTRIEVVDETPGWVDKKGNPKPMKDLTGAISFGTFAQNGKTNILNQRSLFIYNNSQQAKTFDVEVEFQTLNERYPNDFRSSNDADENGVQIHTDQTITVNGNGKKKTTVFISVPKTADLGTYEGYVTYTNQENPDETYQVPFAIRTTEEGIESVELVPKAITTTGDYRYPGIANKTDAMMKLISHMRTVDVVLVDGETNEELGLVGTLDGIRMNEKVNLYIKQLFYGLYYPFTGNSERPIAHNQKLADPGSYKLRFIGTNDAGKTFSKDTPVYIESIAPEIKLDMETDVYEYKPEEKTVTVSGTIFDKEIEDMKSAGFDFTQGNNKMFYQDQLGGRQIEIPVKEDGTFSVDIPVNQTRPMHLKFFGTDAATNRTYKESKNIYFVREGEAFAFMRPEKNAVLMGETAQTTLSLNNVENVTEAVYSFYYRSDLAAPIVKPHASVSDSIDITIDEAPYSGAYQQLTITAKVKEGQPALSGDLTLVDVAFKMNSIYSAAPIFYPGYMTASYTDKNNKKIQALSANPDIYITPTYSLARGPVDAEAFIMADGSPKKIDYVEAGVKVTATGTDGHAYEGIYYATAASVYEIHNLPLTDSKFKFELNAPGHFTIHDEFTIGYQDKGKIVSQNKYLTYQPAQGGDVNKDDVIDVMDALYIQTHWGKNKREADINYDGKVDAKDLEFVQKNYLMRNPTVDNAPKPVERFKGKTLEHILRELGM
ncbi:S8 family serine peptidase [Sporosarcina sp. NPDC096371]|uniref:S8 family serine peptidase n=1 Tax=Sporosarcina sp. NPDC096371 TaxID=3364530 RepID=UPI00382FB4D5